MFHTSVHTGFINGTRAVEPAPKQTHVYYYCCCAGDVTIITTLLGYTFLGKTPDVQYIFWKKHC